jgi:hypothetical protein
MIFLTLLAIGASAAPTRNFYTDTRIAQMRENLTKYDWARKQRDDIIAKADKWAAYDDARLRTLVIPPQVPRCYDLHNGGCPIHGTRVYEHGFYDWIIDFDRPFRVKCPVGGEEYPSNDFAAYLASGMNDRSLLTGDYADDGWGWHKPGDETSANYWFVAYYTHWSMQRWLMEAVTTLSEAALITEDPKRAKLYAHKCALLLWQLAEYYPDYDYAKQSREGKEHNPNYQGKLTNHIWEISTPNHCAPAYDAIRPFLAADADLRKLAGKTCAEIDQEIRDRLLMEAARRVMDGSGQIAGNYGMHQGALLNVALALDEKTQHPTSREMIEYVINNASPRTPQDMGLKDALVNMVYRDGVPMESIGYNRLWIQQIVDIAEGLTECGYDFFGEPKMRKLLDWPFDMSIGDKLTPDLGDTGDMFCAAQWSQPSVHAKVVKHLKDARYEWSASQGDGGGQQLFEKPSDVTGKKPKRAPAIGNKSRLFPAYGLANLQFASRANRVASSLFFSPHPYHKHADQLNLMLFAYGNCLLTDIGYPEQTDAFNHRLSGYFTNTIAHNTVTIDGTRQRRGPSTLHAYSERGFAQVVDASCEGAYPDTTSLYRRADVLVQVTPEHGYVFDAFYVRGGKDHVFAMHGPQADFSIILGQHLESGPNRSGSPNMVVQPQGTFAGPDVPYEQFYDDPELKDKPLGSVSYSAYVGSGFQFLTNLQRAPLNQQAMAEWKLTEPLKGQPDRPWRGIGLRAHLLGQDEELIACDGPVQHYEWMPESVKCLIRRRTGEDLQSRFVTVFEPYRYKAWIRRVSPVRIEPEDGDASAALIEMEDGSRHYVFHSLHPERRYVLDGKVRVSGQAACLVLNPAGKPAKAMLLNGKELAADGRIVKGRGVRSAKIKSVHYEKGIIELADPVLDKSLGGDLAVLVRGPGFSDSLLAVEIMDNTRFSVGDQDLRVAGGPVQEIRGRELITPIQTPNALPGMTLLNSRMEPVGRIENKTKHGSLVDRPIQMERFPRNGADSAPRYYVTMAGPGDEILIPDQTEMDWSSK